jgi:hypothetical protein
MILMVILIKWMLKIIKMQEKEINFLQGYVKMIKKRREHIVSKSEENVAKRLNIADKYDKTLCF